MMKRIDLGWTNIIPCTKMDWVNSSIPGVKVPVLRTAPQELHAFLLINLDDDSLAEAAKECALAGLAAAGIASILESPVAAWPAFKVAFIACAQEKANKLVESIENSSLTTEAICRW
jgi:hypothetical protein